MPEVVDAAVEEVLRRWRPGLLDPDLIAVTGPPGSGRTTLRDALAATLHPVRVVDGMGAEATASVALVTLDATAPLGREELGHLAAATAHGTPVVAVLTRIDLHDGWRSVLDRDLDLLAAHAPTPVTVVPVSATTGHGITELAAALRDALTDTAARSPGHVRLLRARALARAALADLTADEEATGLRERRATLVADRDAPRTESAATLRRLTALARVDLTHRVAAGIRAATATVRGEVDRADRAALRGIPERMRDELAALTRDLDAATTEALDRIAVEVLGGAGGPAGADSRPPAVDDPHPRVRGVEDRMMIVLGASAGAGLGRVAVTPLSGIAALDVAVLPVTLLVGGVAAWALTRMRALAADRTHLRTWVGEAAVQARAVLEQRVQARLVDAEAGIVDGIRLAHERRTRDSAAAVAALDRELRDAAARASGRIAAVERDLAVLDRALAAPSAWPRPDSGEPFGSTVRPTTQ